MGESNVTNVYTKRLYTVMDGRLSFLGKNDKNKILFCTHTEDNEKELSLFILTPSGKCTQLFKCEGFRFHHVMERKNGKKYIECISEIADDKKRCYEDSYYKNKDKLLLSLTGENELVEAITFGNLGDIRGTVDDDGNFYCVAIVGREFHLVAYDRTGRVKWYVKTWHKKTLYHAQGDVFYACGRIIIIDDRVHKASVYSTEGSFITMIDLTNSGKCKDTFGLLPSYRVFSRTEGQIEIIWQNTITCIDDSGNVIWRYESEEPINYDGMQIINGVLFFALRYHTLVGISTDGEIIHNISGCRLFNPYYVDYEQKMVYIAHNDTSRKKGVVISQVEVINLDGDIIASYEIKGSIVDIVKSEQNVYFASTYHKGRSTCSEINVINMNKLLVNSSLSVLEKKSDVLQDLIMGTKSCSIHLFCDSSRIDLDDLMTELNKLYYVLGDERDNFNDIGKEYKGISVIASDNCISVFSFDTELGMASREMGHLIADKYKIPVLGIDYFEDISISLNAVNYEGTRRKYSEIKYFDGEFVSKATAKRFTEILGRAELKNTISKMYKEKDALEMAIVLAKDAGIMISEDCAITYRKCNMVKQNGCIKYLRSSE